MSTDTLRRILAHGLRRLCAELRTDVRVVDWSLDEFPPGWRLRLACAPRGATRGRRGLVWRGSAAVPAGAAEPRGVLLALSHALAEVALSSGYGVRLWAEGAPTVSSGSPAAPRRARGSSRASRCG